MLVLALDTTTRAGSIAVARDGRVFIAERKGALKVYQPALGTTKTVAAFKVFTDNEQGLIGVAVDQGDGTFEFEDQNATRFPIRYYRFMTR